MEAKVLVVDNDSITLQVIRGMLSESGYDYRVTTAKSAEEALVICRLGNFDLILTDLVMGKQEMDGIGLANAVASWRNRHQSFL